MQRYFVNKKVDNTFQLDEKDSHHVLNVMRMKKEENIEVIYNEEVYLTKIVDFNPVILVIIRKIERTVNETKIPKVTICQSLVSENKMDLILQKGTELGAYSFISLKTVNSIIKGNDKDFNKKITRWERIVYDASRQSKRNNVPIIEKVMDINELIKHPYDLKILCTVNEMSTSLKNVLQNNKNYDTMIIVVGPEGGFTNKEEELLIQNGFISTSLGNLVLRTETTALAVLSMINYEFER